MNPSKARALFAGAVALLCAGCATIGGERVPAAQAFDIVGRMLVSNAGRAFSASFRWQHAMGKAENEVWLMTPLGQTLAHIVADGSGATLTAADQREYHAFSVEGLTRDALGWPLPVARLQHWVRGEPVPNRLLDVMQRDARDRLALLEQDGWTIRYDYSETAPNPRQPRLVELSQDGQRIRMVIDEWRQSP